MITRWLIYILYLEVVFTICLYYAPIPLFPERGWVTANPVLPNTRLTDMHLKPAKNTKPFDLLLLRKNDLIDHYSITNIPEGQSITTNLVRQVPKYIQKDKHNFMSFSTDIFNKQPVLVNAGAIVAICEEKNCSNESPQFKVESIVILNEDKNGEKVNNSYLTIQVSSDKRPALYSLDNPKVYLISPPTKHKE